MTNEALKKAAAELSEEVSRATTPGNFRLQACACLRRNGVKFYDVTDEMIVALIEMTKKGI